MTSKGRLGVNPAVFSGTPTQSEPRVNTTDSVPSRKKCRTEILWPLLMAAAKFNVLTAVHC